MSGLAMSCSMRWMRASTASMSASTLSSERRFFCFCAA
jgi:hypothetical protein